MATAEGIANQVSVKQKTLLPQESLFFFCRESKPGFLRSTCVEARTAAIINNVTVIIDTFGLAALCHATIWRYCLIAAKEEDVHFKQLKVL